MIQPIEQITITEQSAAASHELEAALLNSLREDLPQATNSGFMLAARDTDGHLIAGLKASTSYGWLLIKLLWVAKAYQRRSLGRFLLLRAEDKALQTGCHSAWLDTSNPDAVPFYLKLGYDTFGELANQHNQLPERHRRWFMKKTLDQPISSGVLS